mmetsp:Transcript_18507/g.38357  ORF Transcript_18507/g.38357 Transcript_18507/m.38357 type:complete len:838 (-) Transcript_18507:159-2672(-)
MIRQSSDKLDNPSHQVASSKSAMPTTQNDSSSAPRESPEHEIDDEAETSDDSSSSSSSCFDLLKNSLRNPDQLTAMISNYSTSYNAVNVGIVLPVLKYSLEVAAAGDNGGDGAYSSPRAESAFDSFFSEESPTNFYGTFFSSDGHSVMQTMTSMVTSSMKGESSCISRAMLNFFHMFPKRASFHRLAKVVSVSATIRDLNENNDANNEQHEDGKQDSIVASSLLAGMIIGQLIGGFFGDILGRRNAMLLVMILQIGGSLGGALFIRTDDGSSGSGGYQNDGYYDGDQGGYSGYENDYGRESGLTVLEQLAMWRFVLGIGAGGVYPLAAVMSVENKGREEEVESDHRLQNDAGQVIGGDDNEGDNHPHLRHRGTNHAHGYAPTSSEETSSPIHNERTTDTDTSSFQRIALTFSTQGLGFLTVPLLAYPMLELRWDTGLIWRVLLAVGAIPGLVVLYLRLSWNSGKPRISMQEAVINELEDAFNHEDEECEKSNDNVVNENETNVEKPNTHERKEGGSLELTSPNVNVEDVDYASSKFDVSSLFSGEVTSSNENNSNDNELPLVENSHLESDTDKSEMGQIGDTDLSHEHSPPLQLKTKPIGLWSSIKNEPNLRKKFAGTAGTWFLFDVLFYGNALFEPLVLEAAFGTNPEDATEDGYSLLQTTVRDSLIVSLISLPGYFVTVLLIGRRTCACKSIRSLSISRCGSAPCFPCYQTPAYIQMQGFLLMFLLYFVIGACWNALSEVQWLLLLLYGGTFFFANYGPNATTFLLPSVTYSEECRSTLNGLSAAAGKMGALVGASAFAPAADELGESTVMVFCACVSLLAWMLTKLCVRDGTHG